MSVAELQCNIHSDSLHKNTHKQHTVNQNRPSIEYTNIPTYGIICTSASTRRKVATFKFNIKKMTIMMTIMMMVMNATDRYIVMLCCFGCHYNHKSRKCGSLHTEANDFFKTMPIQNHRYMNQTLQLAKLDTKEIFAYFEYTVRKTALQEGLLHCL